jgi:hypothetical protein
MSEIVQIKRSDWDSFMKDNDELMRRCQVLLGKIKTLEQKNKEMEKRLEVSENTFTILSESLEGSTEAIDKRRAMISSLLKESEAATH